MRFFLACIAGGIAVNIIDSQAVFFIVLLGSWGALHIISPGHCPHCRKGVKFMADTCHHCGKPVKEEKPAKAVAGWKSTAIDPKAAAEKMGLPPDDPSVRADIETLTRGRPANPPPGWYETPGGDRRYWDGDCWTD